MGADLSFPAHAELLQLFLTRRENIVESIESLLNAQRKPPQYLQDRPLLSRLFEDCFFNHSAVAPGQRSLRGQLEQAYCAMGFQPRQLAGMFNDLIHPAEMTMRAFHFWQQTQWPGRNARARYAHTLFNVYILRCLQFLSMRLWDDDPNLACERLTRIQGILDELWRGSPTDQPAFVRDARWLIPLAQSLPTDNLAAYLEAARLVAEALPEQDALEVRKAHVRMLGGHLTSQIRHHNMRDGLPLHDPSLLLRTRTSNALDFALLVQGLVPLLQTYDGALLSGDQRTRLAMAGAIFQGVSPDPELFLNRVDLLRAYTMIETVFIGSEDPAAYSALGRRHVRLLTEYAALIDRLKKPLRADVQHFKPIAGRYSPYGVIYGYPSTLIELMALKALQREAETRFSLEDVFRDDSGDSDTGSARLNWIDNLRKMPHIDPEVQRLYDYPQQFAEHIYDRIAAELNGRASRENRGAAGTGRLHIAPSNDSASAVPAAPARYFVSTDQEIVAAHRAEPYTRAQLLHERQEGHYLVSYETPGGWMAIKKDLLTEILGAGTDAAIPELPPRAAQVLRLMCADLAQ